MKKSKVAEEIYWLTEALRQQIEFTRELVIGEQEREVEFFKQLRAAINEARRNIDQLIQKSRGD